MFDMTYLTYFPPHLVLGWPSRSPLLPILLYYLMTMELDQVAFGFRASRGSSI